MYVGISFLKCRTAKLLGTKQPGFDVYPQDSDYEYARNDCLRIQVNGDEVKIRLVTGLTCSIKTRKLYYVAVII